MNQVNRSDHHERDEDFDWKKLLHNVWAVRKPVLLSVVVVSVGYCGFFILKLLRSSPTITHSKIIHFTFQGAEKGYYPNKSRFDIGDLIAPNLLAQVYDQVGLSKREISKPRFIRSFSVLPYTPTYDLIIQKYEALANKQRIQFAEAQQLQENMAEEISQLQHRAVRLSFKSKWRAIENKKIKDILRSVPRQWANKMVNDYGVLELDTKLHSKKLFDELLYTDMDYLLALDLLETNIEALSSTISELLQRPNGKRVIDEKTGYYLVDIQKFLVDIQNYDLRFLTSAIRERGISNDPELIKLYYEYENSRLKREKNYTSTQVELIENTLKSYSQKSVNIAPTNNAGKTAADMIQASGDFVDRIANLIKQGDDLQYRQNLYDQILQQNQQLAYIDYQIERNQALIDVLNNPITQEYRQAKLNFVQTEFPVLLSKLRQYLDVVHRLHSRLSKENFGYDTSLYRIDGEDIAVSRSVSVQDFLTPSSLLNPTKYSILIIAIPFATLLVAVIVRYLKEKIE